jgi:hypothetical protein
MMILTELLTVVDGYKWVGTMQICVARMLQESGIFFAVSKFRSRVENRR